MPRLVNGVVVHPFYASDAEDFEFTNVVYNYPIEMDSPADEKGRPVTWETSEHYFQAMKFPGNHPAEIAYREKIMTCRASELQRKARGFAADALRDHGIPDGYDPSTYWTTWDKNSPKVMDVAVREKFKQNPKLQAKLLAIDPNAIIIEATDIDKIWGDGGDGSGKSQLGIILTTLLREYHRAAGTPGTPDPNYAARDVHNLNQSRLGYSLYDYPHTTPYEPSGAEVKGSAAPPPPGVAPSPLPSAAPLAPPPVAPLAQPSPAAVPPPPVAPAASPAPAAAPSVPKPPSSAPPPAAKATGFFHQPAPPSGPPPAVSPAPSSHSAGHSIPPAQPPSWGPAALRVPPKPSSKPSLRAQASPTDLKEVLTQHQIEPERVAPSSKGSKFLEYETRRSAIAAVDEFRAQGLVNGKDFEYDASKDPKGIYLYPSGAAKLESGAGQSDKQCLIM